MRRTYILGVFGLCTHGDIVWHHGGVVEPGAPQFSGTRIGCGAPIRQMIEAGTPKSEIAAVLGIGRAPLYRRLSAP